MSYLEKLLQGVEVQWKPLAHEKFGVAELSRGRVMSKEYLADNVGEYPVYSSQTANNGEIGKIRIFDHDGEAITWTTDGANAGTVFHRIGKFSITNVCGLIKIKDIKELNYKFLFYWLSIESKKHVYSGMGDPKLMSNQMAKILIPIPPLEIQQKIVDILDTITGLTARKKQYNYYRDRLLSFEEREVEWKSLGCLCKIGDGLHGTPKYNDSGEYYFINGNNLDNGKIVFNGNTKKVDDIMYNKYGIDFTVENTIFISINGTIGSVSFYNNEKIVLGKSVAFFNIESSELYSRYLYYFLQTDYSTNYFESQKTGSTIKNLGLKALRTFKIPIPSLEEQARIVAILDKFDILTTSITEGLPKEIEIRKKQYEYYRDMLLTFPKG